ncbi:hypothetical protein D3C84_920690 [compost metagenome]
MVSFTLVCPIERIENRIKKIDSCGFIASGFLALMGTASFCVRRDGHKKYSGQQD